uniref:Apple domain-containing protein n=1 Tax=Haemonchus contortus TaxID=6289 RepID=A0A7I4XVC0_HAECO
MKRKFGLYEDQVNGTNRFREPIKDCGTLARNVANAGRRLEMWAILLLATTVLAEDVCKQRCDRIYQRSLARVGFDDDKLNRLLETQRPLGTLRDICWRIYDNLDCMKQCDRTTQEHEEFASNVRSKCRYVLRAMESPLKCISRHHSSIGERCTTFLKEAEKLKSLADPSYKPSQRVCRYLHLNTLCLENSVTMYCANAKKLFRRLNFRDYFLNFILPSNDTLFDDLDLDACQMYDFVKQNNKMSDAQLDKELTTVINYLESSNEVTRPMMFTTTSTTSTNSQEKKEFTSLLEELLEDPLMSSSKQPIISKVAATSTTGTQQQSSRKTTSKFSITSTSTTTTSAPTTTSSTVLTTSTKRPFITATNSAQSTDSTDLVDDDDGDYGDYEADIAADNLPEEAAIDEGDEISEASSTARNRVFSEDSWEFTPPNFRYSSMRFENGGVTPLSIDTSTLFGMDDDDDEYAGDGNEGNLPTEVPSAADIRN